MAKSTSHPLCTRDTQADRMGTKACKTLRQAKDKGAATTIHAWNGFEVTEAGRLVLECSHWVEEPRTRVRRTNQGKVQGRLQVVLGGVQVDKTAAMRLQTLLQDLYTRCNSRILLQCIQRRDEEPHEEAAAVQQWIARAWVTGTAGEQGALSSLLLDAKVATAIPGEAC